MFGRHHALSPAGTHTYTHTASHMVWREATLHELMAVTHPRATASELGFRATMGAAGLGSIASHTRTSQEHDVQSPAFLESGPTPARRLPLRDAAASSSTVHAAHAGLATCGLQRCPPCWLWNMLLALNVSKAKKKKNLNTSLRTDSIPSQKKKKIHV